MTTDHVAQPWALRSTLIAVADLDRSIGFYGELGPFGVVAREDAIAVVGDPSPGSLMLVLRETRGLHQVRHGQQSLGLRSMTFNVGSPPNSIGSSHSCEAATSSPIAGSIADGASDLMRGRDPDNLPLAFVSYAKDTIGSEYYESVISMFYSMDA